MDIDKFFTAADVQNMLVLMQRASLTGDEAVAYVVSRQKLIAALNHLKAVDGNDPQPAE